MSSRSGSRLTIADAESSLSGFVGTMSGLAAEPLEALVPHSGEEIAAAQEFLRSLAELSVELDTTLGAVRGRIGSATARARSHFRFTDAGIQALSDRLEKVAGEDRERAAQLLMIEYADALCDATPDALGRLLAVGGALHFLDDDTDTRLHRLTEQVAAQEWAGAVVEVAGLRERLRDSRRRAGVGRALNRLAVFQAHLHVMDHQPGEARSLLLSELDRKAGWFLRSELAYLLIRSGDLEEADHLARELVAQNPEKGDGYLAQAALTEDAGDGAGAAELYREGLPLLDIVRLEFPERGSLLPTTGLFHRERALLLERLGLPAAALPAADRALTLGVRGPELYPETVVYELQARLLGQIEGRESEEEDAAYEAGRRRLWSSDFGQATPLLELAARAGERFPFVGWEIASALQVEAWLGRNPPDPDVTGRGEDTWVAWCRRVRPPAEQAGWIYYVGANLAEDAATASRRSDGGSNDGLFRALQRAEQALVYTAVDAKTWGTLARVLSSLGLTSVAMEAAERGSRIDPDEPEVQMVFLRLCSNAGRFERASEILGRIPDLERNPWLLGVRGWLRMHRNDPTGALDDLSAAQRLGHPQPAWCADLRAEARLELNDVEGALRELRSVVALESNEDGAEVIQARALALVGETSRAQEVLTGIRADLLPDRVEYLWDCVLVDACLGDTEAMLRHTTELASQITNFRQLNDARDSLRRSISLLDSGGVGIPGAVALQRALDLLSAESPVPVPTPEEELDAALARLGGSLDAAAAVRAVVARRLGEAGREDDAVSAYEALRGTSFETEAKVALAALLKRQLSAAIAAGDPEEAAGLFDRLGRRDSGFLTRELAVAEAWVRAGRSDEAVALLESSVDDLDPVASTETEVRLGEIRAARGETDAAMAAMEQALRSATASSTVPEIEVARIDMRLGALAALANQSERAAGYLANALQLLDREQVVDPGSVLALELRLAVNHMGLPRADLLADEYARLCPDRPAEAELLRP